LIEINRLLQQIHYYTKVDNPDDCKQWVDRYSSESIFETLFKLYVECDASFIEVQLPSFPHTVMYMDKVYNEINEDYVFPPSLIQGYNDKTQTPSLKPFRDSLSNLP